MMRLLSRIEFFLACGWKNGTVVLSYQQIPGLVDTSLKSSEYRSL